MFFTRLVRFALAVAAVALFVTTSLPQVALGVEPLHQTVTVQETYIDVYYYRPAGDGKFPLLILSHGSPRDPKDLALFGENTLRKQAEAYVTKGVAVAVPIRRGYGDHGKWAETYGGCANPNYYRAGTIAGEDIQATIVALSRMPEIDASRIVLMGVSAGGWASVAAGMHGGILGVVNFAGGRGSFAPDNVCSEDKLVLAARQFGQASRVPELWIYSQNDHFFRPDLAQRMFQGFTSAGGNGRLIMAPPFGEDGHQYINAIHLWKPHVDDFLRDLGFLPPVSEKIIRVQ